MTIKHLSSNERGFTLIETFVVILVIAILVAIAIPTFLGARHRAQCRSGKLPASQCQKERERGLSECDSHGNRIYYKNKWSEDIVQVVADPSCLQ